MVFHTVYGVFLRFSELAGYYEKLENVSSRLAMIDIMAEMLSDAENDEIRDIVYMTQGVLGAPFEGLEMGIAEKLAEAAIAIATGFEKERIYAEFKRIGDLGSTAEEFAGKTKLRRMGKEKPEVKGVFETMRKIAATSGEGSQELKIRLFAQLIASSDPLEARYIVRFAMGTLRLGLGDATILEALSKMHSGDRKLKSRLEEAYNICSDLGKVAFVLKSEGMNGIENFSVSLFSPVRPALAERLPTAEQILEKMGGRCAVESKYDGMRAQVHMDKKKKRVEIFSRNLERVTEMFPEIVDAALSEIRAESAIFEGEAIAYDEISNEFHAFQETIQRKRKHGIKEKSESLPLRLFVFDLLYMNGEDYLGRRYEERADALDLIVKEGKENTIKTADRIIAKTPGDLERYFEKAIADGLEGIVAKELDSKYIAGARKFSWIKLKRSYKSELSDTVDLAIVGYFLGRGSRAEFGFGGLLGAVYNEKRDMFETITKIGTGFTEEQMKLFSSMLGKIRTKGKPVRVDSLVEPDFWVDPEYVVTVKADEITRSPMHTCGRERNEKGEEIGYALRFPRIVSEGIREDKSAEDATTTKEIMSMFKMQKKTRIGEE